MSREATSESMADFLRKRAVLLAACDHLFLADSPASPEVKAVWATYRQALRDLPDQEGFNPDSVIWPELPEE